MSSHYLRYGLFQTALLGMLTACSLKPGNGSSGGSDVVQPLWTVASTDPERADPRQCPNMVALLIGIGHYDPANGWEDLHTQNDVDRMTETLLKRGVNQTNIHTLADRQATKAGIERALTTLADTLRRGTQLIVLYAGHARQLPDDTGDETDGYDEAIVPYDAAPAGKPQPGTYLRDDELNQYLTRIRSVLGSSGSLWLIFDSCHSQTLNRGQQTQRIRGGIGPMGPPAPTRSPKTHHEEIANGSDWFETPAGSPGLAPYGLFAATTDGGPNFETTDASGRSGGPLTRAISEVWSGNTSADTYQTLFARVAAAMARYAPYQQPGLEGDINTPAPGCRDAHPAPASGYRTTGERLRVAWPRQDADLTRTLTNLPFVQLAATHPDLRIDHRRGGYTLSIAANGQSLSQGVLSADACAERIRQYFARNVLWQLQQTNPDYQVQTTMQRVAVQTEAGQIVTHTLPDLRRTGLPAFRTLPGERMILTLTNTGPKPTYLTVVDLQPDGSLHVLLPEAGHLAAEYRLLPGQSVSRRVRMTEPLGAEVYKLLLTPDPLDLRAVLQTRGNYPARHPYETIFQRTYATRGTPETPAGLSDESGGTGEVGFWVSK